MYSQLLSELHKEKILMTPGTLKLHYQNKKVAQSYDRERFTGIVGRTFDYLEKRALRGVLRKVVHDTPSPSVLDIPCGTGRITELLLSLGLKTTGADISSQMLEVAKERCESFNGLVTFSQLDLDHLDVDDNSYDLVTCIRLFHHLGTQARESILRELARVSRRFVMVNVAYSSRFYRWRRRLKSFLRQGISTSSSTQFEIDREAAAAGLTLVASRFMAPGLSENRVLLFKKS